MPKAPATPEEIEQIRNEIIRAAVALINENGYLNFSMRNLGARLGIAAKTIYNYFANKDELYINILMNGFDILFDRMRRAEKAVQSPSDKIHAMARAYVQFGLAYPHHYNILFSMDVPKARDYLGSPQHDLAQQQNQAALEVARLGEKIFRDLAAANSRFDLEQTPYLLMKTWTILHGIVSLHNSRVTLEVGDYASIIDQMIEEAVAVFRS